MKKRSDDGSEAGRGTSTPGRSDPSLETPVDVPSRLLGPWNLVWATFFFFLWILPIIHVNLTTAGVRFEDLTFGLVKRDSDLSLFLNNQYRISCLFHQRVPLWRNLYFEVRLRGEEEWREFPERQFAPMHCFGYRTRVRRMFVETNQVLAKASHRKRGNTCRYCRPMKARREELARFVKERFDAQHRGEAPVAAVRIVRVSYPVGRTGHPLSEGMARPTGHWSRPPLAETPPEARSVVFTSDLSGRATGGGKTLKKRDG